MPADATQDNESDLEDDDIEPSIALSEPNDIVSGEDEDEDQDIDIGSTSTATSNVSRGHKHFITERVVSALDNAKVSDGKAVHLIIAVAEALGHRVEELVINRSSIRRIRTKIRQEESQKIQADLIDNVN